MVLKTQKNQGGVTPPIKSNKMNLDNLIEKAIIDVKYYQERLKEAELKLDAYYTARDLKEDITKIN
jgi:hypothetical protein